MADLDFAILADYVRAENGLLHLIAGGVDTIYTERVPAVQNLGLGLRFLLTPGETGRTHALEIIFQDEDGERIFETTADVTPVRPSNHTPGERIGFLAALNLFLPLPREGRYSFEILFNGTNLKTIPLAVRVGIPTRPLPEA